MKKPPTEITTEELADLIELAIFNRDQLVLSGKKMGVHKADYYAKHIMDQNPNGLMITPIEYSADEVLI